MLHINCVQEPHVNQDSHTECCTLTLHGRNTLVKNCSYLTQFLKENHQNSTWISLHVSHNIVCSQIFHKQIHIRGWKDQTSKEIATCGKFVSPQQSCWEQATAGMLRPFPVHFVPLQSFSTDCNVHHSHVATENCMNCGFSYETDCWRNYCEKRFWMITDNGRSNRMLHVNCAWEPHIN